MFPMFHYFRLYPRFLMNPMFHYSLKFLMNLNYLMFRLYPQFLMNHLFLNYPKNPKFHYFH
jgi:hypothetical protein